MKERINWIDWVKAWCMTVVVFDHTPHDASPFLLQFLAGTNLASFFFISGYLKKPIVSQTEALKKYFYCLIIPYFIYNAIFFPYWIGKTYIEQGGMLSVADSLKPIIGTMFGQLNSSLSCELNGVTWFLLSLFAMHCITDYCNRQRHSMAWMLGISIMAMILYGANKYYLFAPCLPFHGLVRCICFFFLGNMLRNANFLKMTCLKKDFFIGISALGISLLLFYWHIQEQNHITLFYTKPHIRLCCHPLMALCRQHQNKTCPVYLHRNHGHLWTPSHAHRHGRLRHGEIFPSHRHQLFMVC